MLNVKTNKEDQYVDVHLEMQEIHMLDACKVLASPIPNVKIIKLARITIVLIRALPLADKELIAVPTTM